MIKTLKGKKAQGFLSDLIGYFMVFLIVVVFWMIAGIITRNISSQINQEAAIDLTGTDFLMLLREPTVTGDTISEMIIKSEFDAQKRNEVAALLKTRFDNEYMNAWNFKIVYPEGKPLELGYSFVKGQTNLIGTGLWLVSPVVNKATLPSLGGGEINIELQTRTISYFKVFYTP